MFQCRLGDRSGTDGEPQVPLQVHMRENSHMHVQYFLVRRNPVLEEVFVLYEHHGPDTCAALRKRLVEGLARAKLKALAAFTCRHWPAQVQELIRPAMITYICINNVSSQSCTTHKQCCNFTRTNCHSQPTLKCSITFEPLVTRCWATSL